ncbi:hypothetical protein [Nocardiopsis coralliicola]
MAPALQVEDRISPTRDEPDEGPNPNEFDGPPEPDDDEATDDGPDWA